MVHQPLLDPRNPDPIPLFDHASARLTTSLMMGGGGFESLARALGYTVQGDTLVRHHGAVPSLPFVDLTFHRVALSPGEWRSDLDRTQLDLAWHPTARSAITFEEARDA